LYLFSSASPKRTADSGVPSQMAAHLRTGSPLWSEGFAGFKPETPDLQLGIASNEPPLLPKPLILSQKTACNFCVAAKNYRIGNVM
jgi:hypothetical protein